MLKIRQFSTFLGALAVLTLGASACGGADANEATKLRLGYFPNLTHATAIAGVEKGIFAQELDPDIRLSTSTFNAGPAAVEALLSGAIDAAYVGPNPAINAFSKSHGAVHVIAGATSGGVALVVKPDIESADDLKGKKIATPQLANTQDVALRSWLATQGLKADKQGGGDVHVVPQENAQTLQTFQSGDIDGAWVPEPWATRLVKEGNGKVLINESQLWPNGQFATTLLVVRTGFQQKHPDVVKRLLQGHIAATDFVASNPAEAQTVVNAGLERITSKKLPPDVLSQAWTSLTFTNDPVTDSLETGADNAVKLGLLEAVDLRGITDLAPLNSVLVSKGRPEVKVL